MNALREKILWLLAGAVLSGGALYISFAADIATLKNDVSWIKQTLQQEASK